MVGNEVLLRGEMSATDLANTIRAIKARVKVPVTYADVWEFWLRNTEIANVVDFITIHILPYWLPPATLWRMWMQFANRWSTHFRERKC